MPPAEGNHLGCYKEPWCGADNSRFLKLLFSDASSDVTVQTCIAEAERQLYKYAALQVLLELMELIQL
jgi:hypothetical protein